MIKQKEQDWVLNIINNPTVSVAALKESGLSPDNTSLQTAEIYKQHEKITNNPLFQDENGQFNETKFDQFYETALLTYNMLSNEAFYDKIIKEQVSYGIDNIFAEPKERNKPIAEYVITPNPDKAISSLIRIGVTEEPTESISEIAQTQKVLANPTQVYDELGNADWSKAEWHDAPNDSFFTDFWDTRVLATYDSDGTHIDPFTGNTVEHVKGQYKLNEQGTYFYENLDGRDVYDKQVLNKMNILTTDGSWWNTYDFFDSDDLQQKSIGGSIMKNAALVGTMFIPYVGPWVAGISVATQLVGLFATFAKMVEGSNSPTLSAIEGWSKSLSRQTAKTQYAQQNTWCWENMINLVGDTVGQLKEMRFLFETAPAIIKGNKYLNWKGQLDDGLIDDAIKTKANYYKELNETKLSDLIKKRRDSKQPLSHQEQNMFALKNAALSTEASSEMTNFIKQWQQTGAIISKGYMTMLVSADTYGEAKNQGASDTEAALLTLGYAAAELALLNSDVGKWILPELKNTTIRNKDLIKKAVNVSDKLKPGKNVSKEQKKEITKHWFKKGMDLAKQSLTGSKGFAAQVVAGGLAEGFEEVSEEFLADFSKSCFNVVSWLREDDTTMPSWENVIDRYSMSLIGGFLGGSLTSAGTTFKMYKENITPEQAWQELIYKLRNNEKDQIFKTIDKVTIANPYLSSESVVLQDGSEVNKPGNIDEEIKETLKQNLNILDDLLKSEGLKLSDNQFLDLQTLKDLRFANLQQSSVAGAYLQDFNTLSLKILDKQQEIKNMFTNKADSDKLTKDEQEKYNQLNAELTQLREKKNAYLRGDYVLDFVGKALFDLTPFVSDSFTPVLFKTYVKNTLNKDLSELTKEEYNTQLRNFNTWNVTERKDNISKAWDFYIKTSVQIKELLENYSNNYSKLKPSKTLQELINIKRLLSINPETSDEDVLLQNLQKDLKSDIEVILTGLTDVDTTGLTEEQVFYSAMDSFIKNKQKYLSEFEKESINPEIKNMVIQTIDRAIQYIQSKRIIIPFVDYDLSTPFSGYDMNYLEEDEIEYLNKLIEQYKVKNLQELVDLNTNFDQQILELNQHKENIKKSPYTPVVEFIQDFIANSDYKINVLQLFDTVNKLINQNQLENVNLGEQIEDIKIVLDLLDIIKSTVRGAYTDESLNVDNLMGYNITLNELAHKYGKEWEDLPTINSQNADIILQDLNLIENKFRQAKILYDLNQNKKLNIHNRLHIVQTLLQYNKLKSFMLNVDDSWIGKDKVQNAINDAILLPTLTKTSSLTQEQKIILEKEIIAIEDALYEMLNSNEISKSLFNKFDFYNSKVQPISEDVEELSSRNFLAYLASRSVVKRSAFNNTFKNVIDSNQPVAPVSVQEEVILHKVAEIIGNTTNIYKAYNEALVDDFNSKSSKDKKESLERAGLNEHEIEQAINKGIETGDYLTRLFNIHLTEGDPGSGKSTAVNYFTKLIIDSINPDIFKNSWLVHGDTSRAEKQAQELGIQAIKLLSKQTLMKTIYSKYQENRDIDSEGNVKYNQDEIVFKDNQYQFLDHVDYNGDIPSVIMIDEISHYDQIDLQLLQEFAEKHNIPILTSGDFNQSSITATQEEKNLSLTPTRNIFKTSPFIGISMRTSNNQMDKSINAFKVRQKDVINTYYYEDSQIGLRGIKKLSLSDYSDTIDLMLKTREVNENGEKSKISLIYYNIDSPVVKELTSKYPDIFDLKFGSSAQGLEGQYYVVDLTGSQSLQMDKDYYTAITRASQGAVVFGFLLGQNFNSIKDTISTVTVPPKIGYQNYAKQRKEILDNSSNSAELLTIKNKQQVDKPTTKPIEQPREYIVQDDEATLINEIEKPKVDNNTTSPKPDVENGNDFTYTQLFHTFQSFELGVSYDANGKIQFFNDNGKGINETRIDSVLGLLKIFEDDLESPQKDIKFYKDKIRILRRILFNNQDLNSIKGAIGRQLNNEVEHIEFGLVSVPNPGNNDYEWKEGTGIMSKLLVKHKDEKSEFTMKQKDEKIIRKSINALIKLKNGKCLLLPLFNLGNLRTLTYNPTTKVAERIKQHFDDQETNNGSIYQAFESIKTDLSLPKVIRDIATIYTNTTSSYFKLPNVKDADGKDIDFIPAKFLQNWGIQIIQKATSSGQNTYIAEEHNLSILQENGYFISENIYTTVKPFVDDKGNTHLIGNIGHPFVYVSDSTNYSNDLEMEEQYKKQLQNPKEPKHVLRLYVIPPKVSLDSYLRNLFDILTKKSDIKRLGSHLTSYNIWKALLNKDPKLENLFYKNLTSETKQKLLDLIKESESETNLVSWIKQSGKQEFFNSALLQLIKSFEGNSLIDENVNTLVKLINDAGIQHIYYSAKFKNTKPGNNATSVIYSENDYTIDGNQFTFMGKVNSSLFASKNQKSIEELFGSIVEKIDNDTNDNNHLVNLISFTNSVKTIPVDTNKYGIVELKIEEFDTYKLINSKPFSKDFELQTKEELFNYLQTHVVDLPINKDDLYNVYIKNILDGKETSSAFEYAQSLAKTINSTNDGRFVYMDDTVKKHIYKNLENESIIIDRVPVVKEGEILKIELSDNRILTINGNKIYIEKFPNQDDQKTIEIDENEKISDDIIAIYTGRSDLNGKSFKDIKNNRTQKMLFIKKLKEIPDKTPKQQALLEYLQDKNSCKITYIK